MKLLFMTVLLFVSCYGYAQTTWGNIGVAGFSSGNATYTSIAVDRTGTPYVAYCDATAGNKVTVMKYSGSSWVVVGSAGFSAGTAAYSAIAIDAGGTPYVVYADNSAGGKATVMKFNGTSWVTVGSAGFSGGNSAFNSIAIDNSGTPYVVFVDYFVSEFCTVMKFNGTSWVTVGTEGFSAGAVFYTTIAIDGTGSPYVAYRDAGYSTKATVMKYNGSSWVNVGTPGFSAGSSQYIDLALDGSGTPYVVYEDMGTAAKASVMKYNGTNWVNVGVPGFSAGSATYTQISVSPSGTLYVFYSDGVLGGKGTVMVYSGTSWVPVGTPGFTPGGVTYSSLAFAGSGAPIVAYEDYGTAMRASVMSPVPGPLPTPIMGSGSMCVGGTDTLTDATAGGTWSSSNMAVGTVGSTNGVVYGVSAGTTLITYIAIGDTATFLVTVGPAPVIYNVLGGGSYCAGGVGQDIALNFSDIGISYTLLLNGTTVINTETGVGGALDFGLQTAGGVYTVVADYGTSCATLMSGSATITVNPLPSVNAITGGGSYCTGGSCPNVGLDGSESGVNYSLLCGGSVVTTLSGSGFALDFGPECASCAYTVEAVNAVTGCESVMTGTVTVTITGSTTPISGTTTICVGLSSTLTDATTGGTWSSSNTGVATVGSASGLVTGVSSGTTIITYTVGSCFATTVVTVPLVGGAHPIVGLHDLCKLSTEVIFDSAGIGVDTGYWASTLVTVTSMGSGFALITAVNSGIASVTYTLPSGCVLVDTILVNPLPVISDKDGTICQGSTTVDSADFTGGVWTSGNTGVATIGSSSGVIIGVSPGSAIITYTLPTGCIDTTIIKILPVPAPITGVSGMCIGQSTTLFETMTGGSWISGNVAVGSINSTGVVFGVGLGSAIITYEMPTGCLTTYTVYVNPIPHAISGPDSVCQGGVVTFTDAGAGVWISSNVAVGTIDGTGDFTGISAGTVIITFQGGTGCAAIHPFTVNPLPIPIAGPDSVCQESGGTFIHLTSGVGAGTWSSQYPAIASVDVTGDVTGYLVGTTTITFTLPTGCYTTDVINVNPAPGPILGPTTICISDTTNLSDALSGGSWYSNNPFTGLVVNPDTGRIAGVAVGSAIISYVLPTGCMVICSVAITPVPTVISGPSSVCQGQSVTLTDGVGGGLWWSSNTTMATIGSTTGIATGGTTTGTVNISYTLGTCVSPIFNLSIDPLLAITGPDSVCAGNTITLTDSTPTLDSLWLSSNPAVAPVVASGIFTALVVGVTSGTSIITYVSKDGCSTTDTITVNPEPGIIPVGPFTICAGNTISLFSIAPGGTWTCNNYAATGLTPTGTSGCLVTGLTTGGVSTITYTLPTSCYSVVTVTVNPLPAPIIGPVPDTVCQGTLIFYSDFSGPGTWSSVPISVLTIDTASGVALGLDSGTATISYILNTGCYITTTVYINPIAPIAGNPNVCVNATTLFSDNTFGGMWSNDNMAVGTIDTVGVYDTMAYFTGLTTGTTNITYQIAATGCESIISVTVDPIPDTITNDTPFCMLNVIVLADDSLGGTWSSANPAVAVIGSSTGVLTGISAGTVIITYMMPTGCYVTDTGTVEPLPKPIRGNFNVCIYDSSNLYDSTLGGVWTSGDTAVGTISVIGVFQAISVGTTIITYTNPLTGCSINTTVTVHPLPAISVAAPIEMCIGDHRVLTASSVPPASYTWSPAYDLSTTVGPVVISTATVTTVYTVTATSLGWGCISDTTVTVLVDSLLRYIKIVGRDSICMGTCDTLKASGRDGTYFNWHPAQGLSCTICDTVVACPVDTTKYIAVAIDAYGCKDSVEFTVNVLPLPVLYVAENPTIVCRGTPKQLYAFGAWSYTWTPPYFLSCDSCSNPVATDTFNMVYELQGTSRYGCTDSIPVRVSVLDTNFNKAGDDTIICIGGSAQLNAFSHSVNGNLDVPSYLWLPDSFLNSNTLPDPVATPVATTVYSVVITENACFSDTIPVLVVVDQLPVIQITKDPNSINVMAGTAVQLNAVVTVDTAASFEWTPSISLSCADCPNPVATPSVNTTYSVVVTSNHGCINSDTTSINIFCTNAQVFIPNTFTPNGDGVNDLFYVSAKGITMITRMSIYNRWGQLVFQANNIQPDMPGLGWDGTYKGYVVEPDVFDYVIDVVCELGATYQYTGNVSIVR